MIKKSVLFITIIFFALIAYMPNLSLANTSERFSYQASVIDTINLKAGLREITLWGLRALKDENAKLHIEAIDILDNLTAEGEISCRPIVEKFPQVLARCISAQGTDLGLELLSRGLVIIDRKQIDNSDIAKLYEEVQRKARTEGVGIWQQISSDNISTKNEASIKQYLNNESFIFSVGGILVLILLAISVAIIILIRSINIQKDEVEKLHYQEHLLKNKERIITISLLISELKENKHILEAFISLYKQILENVKHCQSDKDACNKIGKSLKKNSILKKETFNLILNNLSYLNLNVANKIKKLYDSLPLQESYISIEETSTKPYIESVLKEAIGSSTEILLDIDKVIRLLELEYIVATDSINDYKSESKK